MTGAGSGMRFGLFGGSFNPVHLGHLLVAQTAWEELALDRVVFLPAARSPFKLAADLAPAGERLRLLRLALAGRPEFVVDDREIRRGGTSYTIDTVRAFRAQYPEGHCYYLIGADLVAQLPSWREAEALATQVEFVVIPRPGEPPVALQPPFRLHYLRGYPADIASSRIRERVRRGLPVDGLVPSAVAECIRNNRLYL